MFLLDTDVISALRRVDRHPGVAAWLGRQRATDVFVSTVSIGEIEKGIFRQQRVDPTFADALAAWLDGVLAMYGDRVLGVDVATARRWGRLCGAIGHAGTDLLIAATALEHGLTVVTGKRSTLPPNRCRRARSVRRGAPGAGVGSEEPGSTCSTRARSPVPPNHPRVVQVAELLGVDAEIAAEHFLRVFAEQRRRPDRHV